MKTIITYLLCILIGFSCFGKKISAKIVDQESHEPLPYAMVKNLNGNYGALSDTLGVVNIEASDNDSVKITYVGYCDVILHCTTLANDSVVEMAQKEIELNEIVAMPSGKPKIKTFGNISFLRHLSYHEAILSYHPQNLSYHLQALSYHCLTSSPLARTPTP